MVRGEETSRKVRASTLTDEQSYIQLDDLTQEGTSIPESSAHKEEWLLLKRSNPLSRLLKKIWNGPQEVSDLRPEFPSRWRWLQYLDDLPVEKFQARFSRRSTRLSILITYCTLWLGILFTLLYPYLIRAPYFYPSDGGSRIPIYSLTCNSYWNWEGKNNACGKDAEGCQPFSDVEYMIRCPALCDRGGWTYSAIAVGDQRVKYTSYEIGGGPSEFSEGSSYLSYPYRADSFACASAVHAGVVSPFFGGCAKISMEGSQSSFPAKLGKYGHWSVGFDSFFPSSFSFRDFKDGISTGCYDPRIAVVAVNAVMGAPVFYLYSGLLGYWVITIVGYWTIALALDPPLLTDPHDMASVYELISVAIQRLLPLCFVLYVEWKCAVKRTLEEGSPVAKILLWYPTFWLGLLNNVTFDRLPVDRLTAKDLKEQAGALTAVGSIAATILTCAIIQAYSLWKSGRFRKYFKIYITFIIGLVLLGSIPGLNLRIHHYILGMMLVPGCATRGSSAYLFQGILIGLILSGVSRWDFASIVETDFALLRGEAGSSLEAPEFLYDPSDPHRISWTINSNATRDDTPESIDGISLLANDFEVYVGRNSTVDLDVLLQEDELFSSLLEASLSQSEGNSKIYLRLARASTENPDSDRGDYTNAAVLEWPEGIWHEPLPGVS